jgi:hypothetical protein
VIDGLIDAELAFWNENVLPEVAPENIPPSLDILKRIFRVPGKIVEIEPKLVHEYEAFKEVANGSEKAAKGILAQILLKMGDAEMADFGDPNRLFTFKMRKRKAYTVDASEFRSPKV